MEAGKRSKNFTEREKMLLIEVAKEFVHIIDNKKTDATTVEAKKSAWMALTNKYNAIAETGFRTEKQLHALYDNLKKKARKFMSDDKSELYQTGVGTVDEKVVALLTPQSNPLPIEFDSSAPYHNLGMETSTDLQISENAEAGSSQDCVLTSESNEDSKSILEPLVSLKRPVSPLQDIEGTPKKQKSLTETKKKNIVNLRASIIQRKHEKQINEDKITTKKLEILEFQRRQEEMKLEKTKILLDLDIELKKVLLESAKIELELKKKTYNL